MPIIMKKLVFLLALFSVLNSLVAQNARKTLDFDGNDDFIDLGTTFGITGGMSIEFWFKTTTTTPSCLFGQANNTPPNTPASFVPVISITSTGAVRAEYWTSAIGEIVSTKSYNDGKWHHVAFTTSTSSQTLYIDGVQIGSRNGTLNHTWWTTTFIGTGYDAGTRLSTTKTWKYCKANIDEVRVWDTILSQSTIKAWYYRSVTSSHPDYSSLRAYYNLDEGSGIYAYDTSANSYTGQLKNFSTNPWINSYAPFISSPSIYINDLASTWPVNSSSASSILSINASLSGNTYVVYGHNNNPIKYNNNNKPSFILKRLSRSWRLEKEGSVSADLIFDYSALDTSNFNTFKLLISADTGFANANIKDGVKTGGYKIKFSNVSIQDSFFYTIGAHDYQKPSVKIKSINELKAYRAQIGAEVTDDGGKYTIRGVCWSTSANPDTSLSTKVVSGSGNGVFVVNLTNLAANTKYYLRAFAYNSLGLTYSSDTFFTTPSASLPTVKTLGLITLYVDSVKCGAEVISDGNVDLTECGLCWSLNPSPTISSSKVVLGSDLGIFNTIIKNLNRGTKYYIRAFATNSVGTSYGGDSSFLTAAPPTVVVKKISSIGYYSANIESDITDNGQKTIIEKGICWSASPNPTLKKSNHKVYGAGSGKYTVPISGLYANTTYYVRAYAINTVDTAYSVDSVFKTVKTSPPVVVTASLNNITEKSALAGGNVLQDGGSEVLYKGVCWSTNINPTVKLTSKTISGNNLGAFTSNITGLSKGTLYHVRAYAINSYDTAYGGDTIFMTLDAAKVLTDSVTNISGTSATCGGTVTSDGGSFILRRGVCWSTSTLPTIVNASYSTDGFGSGHFSSTLSFLTTGTTYYVRAYAVNSTDTAYGNEVIFKTPSLPAVTTAIVTSITGNSALCGGNAVSGDNITSKGVVWSKFPNPTIALSTKTNDGTGKGTFSSSITNLNLNSKYYVRAYATNSVGTAYGNEINFTTADKAVVITANPQIKNYGEVECGGNVTSDGGMTVTQRGVCWDIQSNPKFGINITNDGSGTGNYISLIKNLNPETKYYIRSYAINGVDTSYGEVKNLIITPPLATTGSSSNIVFTDADISGVINARGQFTNISFEYGLTTSYGNTILASPSTSSNLTIENVSAHLTGLNHNTTYHYRILAESEHGKTYGADSVFTTPFNTSITEDSFLGKFDIKNDGEMLLVFSNKSSNHQISIYDIMGNLLITESFKSVFSFPINHSSSIYFIQIVSENKFYFYKVVFMK